MGTGQWILIYVVFMVVLFLPQILAGRKRKKAQETMLDSLKIGDEIVTIGGIHGKIAAVSETTIDKNVKMTISKSAVSRVAK